MKVIKNTLKKFLKILFDIFLIFVMLYLMLALFIIPLAFYYYGILWGIVSIVFTILLLCFIEALDEGGYMK